VNVHTAEKNMWDTAVWALPKSSMRRAPCLLFGNPIILESKSSEVDYLLCLHLAQVCVPDELNVTTKSSVLSGCALLPGANKNHRLTFNVAALRWTFYISKLHPSTPNLSRKPWTRLHQPEFWSADDSSAVVKYNTVDMLTRWVPALSSTVSYFVNSIPSMPRGFLHDSCRVIFINCQPKISKNTFATIFAFS
jgi:hypothetical protein